MAFDLRPYQQRSIDQLLEWFGSGQGNPLMVLPTASGKSLIIAGLIKHLLKDYPDMRIGILTHTKEIISQNYSKLKAIWPLAPAGIYSAGVGRRDKEARVLYAGIQSIHNKALHLGWFDLLLIDECHMVPTKANGRYRAFINEVSGYNPNMRVVGLTATPFRLDSGYLWDGDDAIFSEVATEVSIPELLELEYLCPIVSKATGIAPDLAGAKKRGGEYITADLQEIMARDGLLQEALEDVVQRGTNRNKWLLFCVSIEHAHLAKDFMNERGISAAVLDGTTPKKQREQILADYHSGIYQVLANCNVLTTGFDEPAIDLIAMLRPTKSTSLYIQMVGRGMRLHPSKENCLLLDYAGNIAEHGCIDDPDINRPKQAEEPGEAPIKICPDCEVYCHASVRVCPECGFDFPPPELRIANRPTEAAVMSADLYRDPLAVGSVDYARHSKPGKPPSMRVSYNSPGNMCQTIASEWICFEHEGYARQKAAGWWARLGGYLPTPETIEEALSRTNELAEPDSILIRKEGKYVRVVKTIFGSKAA